MPNRSDRTGWNNLSPTKREAFSRAVGTSSGLYQDVVNRVIQQTTNRHYGMMSLLDRKPGQGAAAQIRMRAGMGATSTAWVAEGASDATADPTYTSVSFDYETLSSTGTITRQAMASGRGYADVLAEEMMFRLDDFNNLMDQTLFDVTGVSPIPTGLAYQLYADTTQGTGVAGALTLNALDALIDRVRGSNNPQDMVLVSSQKGCRNLNALLQADQQFNNVTEIAAGFRVRTYQGIPVVADTNIADDCDVNVGTLAITGLTGGALTPFFLMNRKTNWIEELTPTTIVPLPRTGANSQIFEIYWDGVFVFSNTAGYGVHYFQAS